MTIKNLLSVSLPGGVVFIKIENQMFPYFVYMTKNILGGVVYNAPYCQDTELENLS
jgi:hypothetical protein